MKVWLRSAIWGMALHSGVLVHAQIPDANKPPCENPRTTVEMKTCAWDRFKSADAELNRVYKTLLGKLDDHQHKALLRNAQNEWIKYRDLNAHFESYFYNGGSAKEQIRAYALARMTEARSKEISSIINYEFNR